MASHPVVRLAPSPTGLLRHGGTFILRLDDTDLQRSKPEYEAAIERDIEPLAISALLARLGKADPVEPVTSLDALAATVDFSRVGRAAARFSEEELARLSARTHHALPWAAVRERLPATVGEPLWLAVRGNFTTPADAQAWADVVAGRGAASGRALGRDHLEGMDLGRLGSHPAQGPGTVPSAPARAHGMRDRAGDGQASAAA
jgi:glutamyl/glutaminyl-tRNA synthetase